MRIRVVRVTEWWSIRFIEYPSDDASGFINQIMFELQAVTEHPGSDM